MLGLVGSRRRATSASSAHSNPASDTDANGEDDTLVVEPEQGNVLMHIISQLRPGTDLSRVVLPTFILEPRSMLERITNFMCHPEMLLPIPQIEDPTERFLSVVKFYLSGWHIRPPGVKKPLNPILGEVFSCYWTLPDHTQAFYIAEQTSHHPPKSSYFYMAPEHHIRVDGTLKPRSRFLGNSAASLMEGTAVLSLLNRRKNGVPERYVLTQPNMYARGILFGKMKYELGDHSFVRCPTLGLVADIEFKTKGWVGGTYNAIGGSIKNERTGETLYELSGLWSEEMFIKNVRTGKKEMFFNALRSKPTPPLVRPIEEQDSRESQRLWLKTTRAVKDRNHEVATDEKSKVEDMQREEAALRAQDGVEWTPRLFRRVHGGPGGPEEGLEDLEWIINAQIDGTTVAAQTEQILNIYPILPGQGSRRNSTVQAIPPRASSGAPAGAPAAAAAAGAAAGAGAAAPPAASPAAPVPASPAAAPTNIDLLGLDSGAAGAPPAANTAPSTEGSDITGLLEATGKPPPPGPLMDFNKDLDKSLPTIRRSDTSGSQEVFHDAESK